MDRLVRAAAALLFVALLALAVGALMPGGPALVSASGSFQGEYPIETETPPFVPTFLVPTLDPDPGYPVETGTPFDFPTPEQPGLDTPTPFATPQETGTEPANIFLTEEAERAGGLQTPAMSDTPGPTLTAFRTATAVGVTPQPTRLPTTPADERQGVDWGMFWIGFSLPVLGASGYVLYLIDRRPELFRRR